MSHADHPGCRSRRARPDGRSLQLVEDASEAARAAAVLLGQVRRARQQSRRDGGDAEAVENVLNTYHRLAAHVLHDLHESAPYLYDNTVLDGAYNAWIDPLLTNEWHMIGWNNVQEMTRLGMPGVYRPRHLRQLVTWISVVPGRDSQWHLPPVRDVRKRRHRGHTRSYALARGDLANMVPSESAAAKSDVVAAQQQQLHSDRTPGVAELLRQQPPASDHNFYEKSKRSILKAGTEGPAACVMRADDRPRRVRRTCCGSCRNSTSRSRARPSHSR